MAALHKEAGIAASNTEVNRFAEHIGLTVLDDAEFMWLAEDGLYAPLPSEWTEHLHHEDEGNPLSPTQPYWHNEATAESTYALQMYGFNMQSWLLTPSATQVLAPDGRVFHQDRGAAAALPR